jgi:hypothetical protein
MRLGGQNFLYVFKPRPKYGARDGAACTGKRAPLPPAALKGRDGGGAGGATGAHLWAAGCAPRTEGASTVGSSFPLAADRLHVTGRRQPRCAPRTP